MLTSQEAFALGCLPPLVGVYYSSVEILQQAGEDEGAPLRDAAAAMEGTAAGGREVNDRVQEVAALLLSIGEEPGAAPRTAAEYPTWAQRVFQVTQARLQIEAQPQAACHLLGFVLGDVSLTLRLADLALVLRRAEPARGWLAAQARALEAERQRALRLGQQALAHPLWGAAQREAIQVALAPLLEVPPLDGAPDEGRRVAIAAAALRLEEGMALVSGALAALD